MNDFMKEELALLLTGLNYISEPGLIDLQDIPKIMSLQNKIRSMIDNYCEHDYHETSAMVEYCHKCDSTKMVNL